MVRHSYAAAGRTCFAPPGRTPFRSAALATVTPLSTTEDDFEFDFFDEPDEETITQRRGPVRVPQRPKRGPRGAPRPPAPEARRGRAASADAPAVGPDADPAARRSDRARDPRRRPARLLDPGLPERRE